MKCGMCQTDDGKPVMGADGITVHALLSDCVANLSARVAKLEPVPVADPPQQRKCRWCGHNTDLKECDEWFICIAHVVCRARMACQRDDAIAERDAAVARAEKAEAELLKVQELCIERGNQLVMARERCASLEARETLAARQLVKIVEAGREWWKNKASMSDEHKRLSKWFIPAQPTQEAAR